MKILLLDIETAPNKVYAWGLWNQNIATNQIVEPGYTLCWAAKWLGDKELLFSSMHSDGEEAMLSLIWELLDEADAVVHYNGTKFDMPTLNKEFILHGYLPPSSYKEIDLLKTARRRFKFPSNKLDYIAQRLGLGTKTKHRGMSLWHDCMQGDDKAWSVMERYNKQDVKLLEKLYKRLLPWIKNHPNYGLYNSKKDACRNCGGKLKKNGWEYTATCKYQRYRCVKCGAEGRGPTNEGVKGVIR